MVNCIVEPGTIGQSARTLPLWRYLGLNATKAKMFRGDNKKVYNLIDISNNNLQKVNLWIQSALFLTRLFLVNL